MDESLWDRTEKFIGNRSNSEVIEAYEIIIDKIIEARLVNNFDTPQLDEELKMYQYNEENMISLENMEAIMHKIFKKDTKWY